MIASQNLGPTVVIFQNQVFIVRPEEDSVSPSRDPVDIVLIRTGIHFVCWLEFDPPFFESGFKKV